ncbi:MAG: HD domain-containing protein [Bacilli bacterium]|nr:HD domain-containing protein [Bacilli bacterium]
MFTAALIIQVIGLAIVFGMICYTLAQKPSVPSRNILVILICTGIALLGYLFEMEATTMETAVLAVKIGYLGKPFLLLATFYFVARYSKIKTPRWLFWILCSLCIVFLGIIYTNNYHHLYYAEVRYEEGFGGHYWTTSTKGPLYWVYVAMNVGYFIANLVMSIFATKKAISKKEKRILFYMYALIAVGVLGYIIYLTGITNGYDTTILGLLLDTIIMSLLFWRYSLFDALALAKDMALDIYSNALVILDSADTVIFINKTAKELFPGIKEGSLRKLTDEERRKVGDLYYYGDKIYRFNLRAIEQNGNSYGTIIEFRDVTNDVNYNKRLNEAVEQRTKEIKNIQRQVVYGFANMVEARDQETGDHIKNTSKYVKMIAEALSKQDKYKGVLTEAIMAIYEDVAPLHDVGKIVIPDAILLKPGRLTPEEFEIMKTHTTSGAKFIDDNLADVETKEYLELARNIALHHHERYDGNGYPTKLKGEDIPLEARIMAVADVYDALTSKRPYKEAFSLEKAKSIMLEGRGTQFDPEILDIFFEIIDKEQNIFSSK